jgi:hypothetical protein
MKSINFAQTLATFAIAVLLVPVYSVADDARGQGHSRLKAQLTQYNGGCPPNALESPDGCIDVQFSIHTLASCTNGPTANVDGYSISMIRDAADVSLAGGSSTLVRAGDGLAFNFTTSGLRPNAPYTAWWVAFNPDNSCLAACNCAGPSLRPGVDSIFYATGAMTDELGTVTFAGEVKYGEVPDGFDQVPFGGLFPAGIDEGAEIHFVVRSHGPALRGGGKHR